MSYVCSYDDQHGTKGSSRIETEEAHIAVGILAPEVIAVGVAGGLLYIFYSGIENNEDSSEESI